MTRLIPLLVAAAASLATTGALADAYVGAAVGAGRANIDCEGIASCDKTGTAYKVTGGYGLGGGWAAELGYLDFGTAKGSDGGASAEVKARAVTFGVAYAAALSGDVGIALRAGVASMKTSISGTLAGVGSGSDAETKAKPYVGLGLTYALTRTTALELGADFSQAEYDTEKASVRAVTLGARFAF